MISNRHKQREKKAIKDRQTEHLTINTVNPNHFMGCDTRRVNETGGCLNKFHKSFFSWWFLHHHLSFHHILIHSSIIFLAYKPISKLNQILIMLTSRMHSQFVSYQMQSHNHIRDKMKMPIEFDDDEDESVPTQ